MPSAGAIAKGQTSPTAARKLPQCSAMKTVSLIGAPTDVGARSAPLDRTYLRSIVR